MFTILFYCFQVLPVYWRSCRFAVQRSVTRTLSICRGFLSSVARKSLTETSLATKVVFYWKLPQTTYRTRYSRMLPSMYTHHSFAVNLVLNAQRLVLCSPFCLFALEARCLDALRQWRYVGFGGTDSATGFRSKLGRLCFGRRVKMLHYRIRDWFPIIVNS